jgi:translation initiation factor IF-1
MEKFKEASVVGNIVRRLPNGMVEVNYDGTMVVLPQNTNEIKFEKGGKSSTLNFSNFFYSPLEKVIAESKFAKLPAKQWAEKFGRTEEAKWTGLADWLAQQGGSVSKADIQQFLADNRIRIEEIVKGSRSYTMEDVAEYLFGKSYSKLNEEEKENVQIEYDARALGDTSGEDGDDTKFSKYQLEGEKENYKEILVTLPIKMPTYNPITELPSGYDITFDILKNTYAVIEENQSSGRSITGRYHSTKEDAVKNAIEVINSQRKNVITSNLFDSQFKSSHFYEPNILVHLRMNTRTDAAGNKVLFLEEIQSDWGQKGKREGFGNRSAVIKELPNGTFSVQSLSDGTNVNTRQEAERVAEKYKIKGIAPAPFVTDTSTWVKLALKVALKEAIAQGAAKIAWTTGEQQNDRYDLSKSVDEIIIVKQPDGTYIVAGIKDGRNVINENSVAENRVELFVGKHIANKAINEGQTTFSGSDLKVGGKGMTGFYGSPKEGVLGIVGNVAKSLFKQQPKTVEIEVGKKYSGYIEVLDMEGNVVNTYGGAASTTHNAEIEGRKYWRHNKKSSPKSIIHPILHRYNSRT